MSFWNRRKSVDALAAVESAHRLKPTLSWWHLIAMGVGAIVGTGIYTLTGISAGLAGPAVILSFLLCGVICACAALCYAEMATVIPAAGSAYTYSYAVLGEVLAWIVGRLEGTAGAVDSSVGRVPARASLDVDGLELAPGALDRLFEIDPAAWLSECDLTENFFARFGARVPPALMAELESLRYRLRH